MLPDTAASKVTAAHLCRTAYLYVRQSSLKQVLHNTESAIRQYDLRGKAIALGWAADQITVIDVDQGQSADREGFQQLVAEVSLGRAGIVLGLECSRLARNNALFRYRNKAFCSAYRFMPRTVVPFLVRKVGFPAESA